MEVPDRQPQQQQDGQQRRRPQGNDDDNVLLAPDALPWLKFSVVLTLIFLAATLQVTVWSLEVYVVQRKQILAKTKSKFAPTISTTPISLPTFDDEENIEINTDVNKMSTSDRNRIEMNVKTTTSSSSSHHGQQHHRKNNKSRNSKSGGSTVKNSIPMEMEDIYLQNRYLSGNRPLAETGTSIPTIANAYWNQVEQSGIFDWEMQDSTPSIGSSDLLSQSVRKRRGSLLISSLLYDDDEDDNHNGDGGSISSNLYTKALFSIERLRGALYKYVASFFVPVRFNAEQQEQTSSSQSDKSTVTTTITTTTATTTTTTTATSSSTLSESQQYERNDGKKSDDYMNNHNESSSNHNNNSGFDFQGDKHSNNNSSALKIRMGLHALQKAAEYGHPEAQFRLANALAVGFYPYIIGDSTEFTSSSKNTKHTYDQTPSHHYPLRFKNVTVKVSDEWLLDGTNPIHSNALLLWRMAAQHGSIDASIILANHIDSYHLNQKKGQERLDKFASSKMEQEQCIQKLPYYAAAAHGIIDELQASDQSRGYVLPAKDKHTLYRIHMHGSSASRLDDDNKADERLDTLEFYQVKASTLFNSFHNSINNNKNKDDAWIPPKSTKNNEEMTSDATGAAFTLARYYHHGLRGAPQNLTLALQYYEVAAYNGHWEAAGLGGMLYLWGIGTKQDTFKAHKLFNIGMPFGYEGCLTTYQLKLKQNEMKQKQNSNAKRQKNDGYSDIDEALLEKKIYLCDDNAMNGMGLLYLFGLSMIAPMDRALAVSLFQLARDQGNSDAAYNLAMIRLGWKTHYVSIHSLHPSSTDSDEADVDSEELKNEQTIIVDDEVFPLDGMNMKGKQKLSRHFPTKDEYRQILADLVIASGKMHILATHRLGMMYEYGIQIPVAQTKRQFKNPMTGSKSTATQQEIVPKDCLKASKFYKSIIEQASSSLNTRMRLAYKLYMNGNTADSLRHYLAVAETGNSLAQLNAAFLFDQGECLNGLLTQSQCAAAAVRLWKAVSEKGDAEASLRVGDYYYYGKFRFSDDNRNNDYDHTSEEDESKIVNPNRRLKKKKKLRWPTTGRPFAWIQHILFPEEFLIPYIIEVMKEFVYDQYELLSSYFHGKQTKEESEASATEMRSSQKRCSDQDDAASKDGSCPSGLYIISSNAENEFIEEDSHKDDQKSVIESDLVTAAHFYRLAADRNRSPRANYNLGFMYQWGLGLKQDFPLAKRHYDLAIVTARLSGEAHVPVAIALNALSLHEYFLKLMPSWELWIGDLHVKSIDTKDEDNDDGIVRTLFASKLRLPLELSSGDNDEYAEIPTAAKMKESKHPVPGSSTPKTNRHKYVIKTGNPTWDIIIYHLLTLESLIIFVLTIIVCILLQRQLFAQRILM